MRTPWSRRPFPEPFWTCRNQTRRPSVSSTQRGFGPTSSARPAERLPMKWRTSALAALLVSSLFAFACGGGSSGGTTTPTSGTLGGTVTGLASRRQPGAAGQRGERPGHLGQWLLHLQHAHGERRRVRRDRPPPADVSLADLLGGERDGHDGARERDERRGDLRHQLVHGERNRHRHAGNGTGARHAGAVESGGGVGSVDLRLPDPGAERHLLRGHRGVPAVQSRAGLHRGRRHRHDGRSQRDARRGELLDEPVPGRRNGERPQRDRARALDGRAG